MDHAVPERVDRYRVIGRLAVGGMAEILIAAIDGAAGFTRPVVIKRVLPKHARRADFRRMFVDEARIVSGLHHANVVDVLELGEEGDSLYLVMEYLEGESLDVVMKKLGLGDARMPPAIVAHVIAESCAGLNAAHNHRDADGVAQEIVHRDVSPHNLFLGYDGGVKVIDFGIAKAVNRETKTETGTVKGKFAYMSPEQIDGRNVDRRTDVFALGVVLSELLTGRRLFARSNHLEIVKAICFAPIPAPRDFDDSIHPELDRITQKALARDLDERYASAAEMRRDLVAALRELDPGALASEQLASLLASTFPERMEAKRDMLRRIASGSQITSVPGSIDIDLDDLDEPEHAPSRRPPPPAAPAPRGRGLATFAGVIALAAVIGGVAALASSPSEPDPAPTPTASPEPARVAAEDTLPTEPSGPIAPEAATITVTLDTVPPGAAITIDGEPRGASPAVVALPRSDGTYAIAVALEGFVPARELIDASVDQRLRIVLERERRAPSKRPPPPPGERPSIFRVD